MDALTLINTNTELLSNKLDYKQIEPFELEYISMEEIIRVCFLYLFLLAFIVVFVFVGYASYSLLIAVLIHMYSSINAFRHACMHALETTSDW